MNSENNSEGLNSFLDPKSRDVPSNDKPSQKYSKLGIDTRPPDDKKKEKELFAKRDSLKREAESIFDHHISICRKIQVLTDNIDSIINDMNKFNSKTSSHNMKDLRVSARLRVRALFNDLNVARSRLRNVSKSSESINLMTRESVFNDIELLKEIE